MNSTDYIVFGISTSQEWDAIAAGVTVCRTTDRLREFPRPSRPGEYKYRPRSLGAPRSIGVNSRVTGRQLRTQRQNEGGDAPGRFVSVFQHQSAAVVFHDLAT